MTGKAEKPDDEHMHCRDRYIMTRKPTDASYGRSPVFHIIGCMFAADVEYHAADSV